MKSKKIISVICIGILVVCMGIDTFAHTGINLETYNIKALGRMEYDYDKSGTAGDHPSDFVYDASDIVTIASMVKTGKIGITDEINTYPNQHIDSLSSFGSLKSAIAALSDFPKDTYYYDSASGMDKAEKIVRYIKENGQYYLCDQYGNKTSNEIQKVNKENLIEYKGIQQNSLSAGTAGMINKRFILGNGADNMKCKKEGIEAAKVGDAAAENVLSGKTFTNAEKVGVKGTMEDRGAWTNTPAGNEKVTIPEGYHNGEGYIDTSECYKKGYDEGVTFADNRVNSENASYKEGYNQGVTYADGRLNIETVSYKEGYKQGVAYADGRVNTNSVSYKDGYNKGVINADGRVNKDSASYAKGYTEGYAAGQANVGNIAYTYHVHGDGHCNETPVYHVHDGDALSGGTCYTGIKCGNKLSSPNEDDSCYCSKCHDYVSAKSAKYSNYICQNITRYDISCGKTTSTVESYYCSLTSETIISATIIYR